MKRFPLIRSVALGLTVLAACSGPTQTCTATGLTPGKNYTFSFVHGGSEYSGEFSAESSSVSIPDIPSSIDRASINISLAIEPLIAMEVPAV